jgi:two-component system invasion response regulator UvrY
MTSVLIVDDHPVVLQGCRRILEDAGITLVFEASDTATGYELFRNHRPDVGVIDLSIRDDGLGGMSLVRRINVDDPRFGIYLGINDSNWSDSPIGTTGSFPAPKLT